MKCLDPEDEKKDQKTIEALTYYKKHTAQIEVCQSPALQ